MQDSEARSLARFALQCSAITGEVKEYSGFNLPNGFLWAKGDAVSRSAYANLMDVITIKHTGVAMTYGSPIITVPNVDNLCGGQPVESPNLPTGTFISSITDNTHIMLSENALSNATTSTIKIFHYGNGDGSTIFNLPNKSGRVGIGAGQNKISYTFKSSYIIVSTNIITVASNDSLYTGTKVVFTTDGNAPAGLTAGNTYYVIRDSATTIRLATTSANAVAGTAIDITSQGTGTHKVTATYSNRVPSGVGGEESHTLVVSEMPSHTHNYSDTYNIQDLEGTFNNANACDEIERTETTTATGGSQSHSVMNPYIVLNYVIKY